MLSRAALRSLDAAAGLRPWLPYAALLAGLFELLIVHGFLKNGFFVFLATFVHHTKFVTVHCKKTGPLTVSGSLFVSSKE